MSPFTVASMIAFAKKIGRTLMLLGLRFAAVVFSLVALAHLTSAVIAAAVAVALVVVYFVYWGLVLLKHVLAEYGDHCSDADDYDDPDACKCGVVYMRGWCECTTVFDDDETDATEASDSDSDSVTDSASDDANTDVEVRMPTRDWSHAPAPKARSFSFSPAHEPLRFVRATDSFAKTLRTSTSPSARSDHAGAASPNKIPFSRTLARMAASSTRSATRSTTRLG